MHDVTRGSPAQAVAARAANTGVPEDCPTSSQSDPSLPDLNASLPAGAASMQRRPVVGNHMQASA